MYRFLYKDFYIDLAYCETFLKYCTLQYEQECFNRYKLFLIKQIASILNDFKNDLFSTLVSLFANEFLK